MLTDSEVNNSRSLIKISRRSFIKGVVGSVLTMGLSACFPEERNLPTQPAKVLNQNGLTDEFGEPITPFDVITTYNNFYEYSTNKRMVARLATEISTSPWEVTVGGLVKNPSTFDADNLKKQFELADRVYRMRCVEGWSKIVPWRGFPLSKLIEKIQPASEARFVRFETIFNPEKLPGQQEKSFPWPYVEGLTMEEAMHPLTLIAIGIDGKDLLPQSGAPIRLVVPWKYGFKSIKSIVKIDFVDKMPTSFWMKAGPEEYGFYANVNPAVPHRRWSQATEVLVTDSTRRPTRIFNGYNQVSNLYPNQNEAIWY